MDQETEVQTKFHSFLKQRNSKTNVAMQEAQRLVNLYRVLNAFSPDFVDEYNVMLKNASNEVQTALTALVGGPEVRQYLEFLKEEEQKQDEEANTASVSKQVGWLPSPTEDDVENSDEQRSSSSAMWKHIVEEQDAKMTQMINNLRQEQNEALTRLMNQLMSSFQAQKQSVQSPAQKVSQAQYSEIIEEKK